MQFPCNHAAEHSQVPRASPDETAMLSLAHSIRGKTPIHNIQLQHGIKMFCPLQATTVLPSTASSKQWQTLWKSFKFLMLRMDKTKQISQTKVWFGGDNRAGNSWALSHGLLKCFAMFCCLSQCFWRISYLLDMFSVFHKVLPLLCLPIPEPSIHLLPLKSY